VCAGGTQGGSSVVAEDRTEAAHTQASVIQVNATFSKMVRIIARSNGVRRSKAI